MCTGSGRKVRCRGNKNELYLLKLDGFSGCSDIYLMLIKSLIPF